MNLSADPSLVIYEEEWATESALVGKLKDLRKREDADEWASRTLDELLQLRVHVTDPRADSAGRGDGDIWERCEDGEAASEVQGADKSVPLFQGAGGRWKVPRLVGSGRLPESGLVFEVLPKVANGSTDPDVARKSLRRMWALAADLQTRDDRGMAGVGATANVPLHEWLAQRFLAEMEPLLARGIRRQYVEREDNLGTLRGRVLPLENIRHNAFAPHRLYCRFEELSPDRPENRLIRSALAVLVRGCATPASRRRAALLAEWLHEIPLSRDVRADLALWRDDRLMKHYREIRSTCRWILRRQGISPVRGSENMVGCFARMNDVFERYVARWLALELSRDDELKHLKLFDQTQADIEDDLVRKPLWRWKDEDKKWMRMRPDMLVYDGSVSPSRCVAVLDAKWKQPELRDMSPADIYQVHAYARYWLSDGGQIALVYPHVGQGEAAQQSFVFDDLGRIEGRKLYFKLPGHETSDGASKDVGAGLLKSLRELVCPKAVAA